MAESPEAAKVPADAASMPKHHKKHHKHRAKKAAAVPAAPAAPAASAAKWANPGKQKGRGAPALLIRPPLAQRVANAVSLEELQRTTKRRNNEDDPLFLGSIRAATRPIRLLQRNVVVPSDPEDNMGTTRLNRLSPLDWVTRCIQQLRLVDPGLDEEEAANVAQQLLAFEQAHL